MKDVPYESWAERQIREATERGEFDNLPGAGQPIPGLNGRDEPDWWVRGFLEREKISMPLPTSLALRREVANLPETLADVGDEATARQIVEDLNVRIADSHRRNGRRPDYRHRTRRRRGRHGSLADKSGPLRAAAWEPCRSAKRSRSGLDRLKPRGLPFGGG